MTDRAHTRIAALYRAMLRLYPRPFRQRHGDEMVRLFLEKGRDARARAGRAGLWGHWMRATVDVAVNGLGARMESFGKEGREGASLHESFGNRQEGGGVDAFVKDVKYAARTLRKSPGFTLVAAITIALGIGANTAIFSVVRAVLLQPLPYDEPSELVILWGELRNRDVTHFPMSPPDFEDFRTGAELLDVLAGVFTFQASLTGDGNPVQVDVGGVTPNFFSLMGVEPAVGRGFMEEDGAPQPGGATLGAAGSLPGIVVLSNAFWQQRYGGDPGVIGTTVDVGGSASEIVGVMAPGFELLMPPTAALTPNVDLWAAARIDFANAPRNNVFLRPVGRLRDGATIEQLQSEIDRITSDIVALDQVAATAGYAIRVESLHEDLTAHVRPVLLALFGAVFFVLLIACANVANLLLVRATGRDREFAIRAALGGSRGRLVRQMLIESGLLAMGGALVGIALASGGISLLLALQPEDLPRIESVRLDGTVLGFTVVAAAAAALLFGLLPALQGSRFDLADALKERGSTGQKAMQRLLRNGVVIVEVALSLVLLIGAGLMVRSFVELTQVEPGYEPEGVLTFRAAPPFGRYPDAADRAAFNVSVQQRLEALPGIERAAAVFPLPLSGGLMNGRYGGEEALTDPEAFGQAAYRSVMPGYFEAMGTRLLSGRTFSDADNADSASVVVVDEQLAEALWPDRSPVGERFLVRAVTPEPAWVEVIGVVEHQRAQSLSEIGPETVYFLDRYMGAFGGQWSVRVDGDAAVLVSSIREAVAGIDGDVPVAEVELMTTYVDRSMGPTRFALTLIGVFGVIALILASIGLYGVLSYVVRQRTAEIGVRMAFGAEGGSILKLVVGQGLGLAAAGVLLGLLVAVPATGVMESLLVGVEPTDPLTFAGISALFVAVAALACYLPARRATRVDPVQALREE